MVMWRLKKLAIFLRIRQGKRKTLRPRDFAILEQSRLNIQGNSGIGAQVQGDIIY